MVLTGLALVFALTALLVATVTLRQLREMDARLESYKLTAPQVRELVREIDDALEKLATRQSRESMRRLRSERREPEAEVTPTEPTAQPGDLKSQLWALVRTRGMVGQPRREVSA